MGRAGKKVMERIVDPVHFWAYVARRFELARQTQDLTVPQLAVMSGIEPRIIEDFELGLGGDLVSLFTLTRTLNVPIQQLLPPYRI